MDDLGEIMVIAALIWFAWDDARLERWPYMAGLFALGAVLYFIDRALKRL